MKRVSIVFVMTVTLLLAGCAHFFERGLDTAEERAIALMGQYQAVEDTYKTHYTYAGDTTREWMVENIAPKIDEARQYVIVYAQLVEEGAPDKEKRLAALRLLKEINQKLMEVEHE